MWRNNSSIIYHSTGMILMLAILFACKNDCCDNISTSFILTVKDDQNTDLLNPQATETYNTGDITIFYLIDGEKVSVQKYSGYLDYYPDNIYGYEISEYGTDTYMMKIFPNSVSSDNGLYTTYIKWNDSDTDTIDCEIVKRVNSIYCSRIFYNGEIAWEESSGTASEIEIIK